MRFNGKELAAVALQPSHKFDKEGVLFMKERQEGLFKRGEVYMERWCRLRGNLLFYFKSKDQCSEPYGLILLERCTVELDTKDDLPFSFILVFENDDRIQYLTALSEAERDAWIQALHIASYECMKCQLQSLREQLISRTGNDPLISQELGKEVIGNMSSYLEDPSIEMSLACDNLMCDATGQPPSPKISVSIINPPNAYWTRHAQTETIEKCSNPHFLTTIQCNDTSGITPASRIKLNVYDVRERISGTMTLLGQAAFLVQEICTSSNNQARFALTSPEGSNVGFVTVKAWNVEPRGTNESPKSQRDITFNSEDASSEGILPGLIASTKSINHQMLKKLYSNILTKTYRFHSGLGADLSVHEYMGESQFSFFVPQQLIQLLLREEKERMEELKHLGDLRPEWNQARKELIERHLHLINTYTQAIENINEHSELGFKPSSRKGDRSLEFVPVNLHLQRMWVQNESTKKGKCYDVTTVGAFTAFPQKYKNGGVHRMLMQQQNTSISGVDNNILGPAKLAKSREIKIGMRKAEFIVEDHIESLLIAATSRTPETCQKATEILTEKVRHLCKVCDSIFVEEAVAVFDKAKARTFSPYGTPAESPEENKDNSDRGSILDGMVSWSWNGDTDKRSPDEPEPWDLTRLNVEATLMCVAAKVELLTRSVADRACCSEDLDSRDWVEELKPCIQKLEEAINHLYNRVSSSLTFVTIQESTTSAAQDLTIRYRRDVVLSHAITSVASAFITKVHYTSPENPFFIQIQEIGLLCQFEGLMSCYGDEMGMLEDMWIAVTDLQMVKFLLRRSVNPDDIFPRLLGNRKEITITVPITDTLFNSLPKKLQSGQLINIIPIFFNIGINQHATLAEKFNQMFLQETINADSAAILTAYHDRYMGALSAFITKNKQLDRRRSSNGFEATIPDLLQELQLNVRSKKKKNVEIIHLASEITRKLEGLRFTSCKSAKDRTSMAVTLEQCLLLQKDYDLAPHEFIHALDCMRSSGTRRENTLKNAGAKKYAFNSLQLMALPQLYRPPPGTYGNVQT